jgi:hypothetical protein
LILYNLNYAKIFFSDPVFKIYCAISASYSMGIGGALSPRVNRQGHEVDHSAPTSVKFRTEWSYTYMPSTYIQAQLHLFKLTSGNICYYLSEILYIDTCS